MIDQGSLHETTEDVTNPVPDVSIITVCKNVADTIACTIESVMSQKHCNIEHLIIDGKSIDGTLEIIKNYSNMDTAKIKWLSELDTGIYEAINKGIRLSRGIWIHVLNSGDKYLSSDSLAQILNKEETKEDFKRINQ